MNPKPKPWYKMLMDNPETLDALAHRVEELRGEFAAISADLKKAESALVSALNVDTEAPENKADQETAWYSLRVEIPANRTVDSERAAALRDTVPADLFNSVFRPAYRLDLRAWRAVVQNGGAVQLAECVTTRPGKPKITIARKEDR